MINIQYSMFTPVFLPNFHHGHSGHCRGTTKKNASLCRVAHKPYDDQDWMFHPIALRLANSNGFTSIGRVSVHSTHFT